MPILGVLDSSRVIQSDQHCTTWALFLWDRPGRVIDLMIDSNGGDGVGSETLELIFSVSSLR